MMVYEEEVVSWFQGLKGHQRIPLLRQLVYMCHPLELRFIASCVEDACRTDYLAFKVTEYQANSQTALSMLTSPLDAESRNKIIVYLCLFNSTNKLCSRLLNQKICDHEPVSKFCDDMLKHVIDGEPPTSQKQTMLDELCLLYTLAYLHPSFDFSERQGYRTICNRLNEIEKELQKVEERQERKTAESVVPKPSCDAGSRRDNPANTCCLCFSASSSEHICKLRLLRRSRNPDSEMANQVNVQWSTGKYSNLAIRDSQLRQLHTKLEGIISQPQLPSFPAESSCSGLLTGYLQHLQGLSAVTWPRSQSVFQFFRQLADEQEQEQRDSSGGWDRPHLVYMPRAEAPLPTTSGPLSSAVGADAGKLMIPTESGAIYGEDSETSPTMLDDDAEVKSYTVYNSNISNGRAGSRSPLLTSLLPPPASTRSSSSSHSASPEPSGWPQLPALTNGHSLPARSPDADRLLQLVGVSQLRRHVDVLLPYTLAELRVFSDERLAEMGLPDNSVRRLRALLQSEPSGGGGRHLRRVHVTAGRCRSTETDGTATGPSVSPAAAFPTARPRADVKERRSRPDAKVAGVSAAALQAGGQAQTMPTYSAVAGQGVPPAGPLRPPGDGAVGDGLPRLETTCTVRTAVSQSSPVVSAHAAVHRQSVQSTAGTPPPPAAGVAPPPPPALPQPQQQQTVFIAPATFATRPPPMRPSMSFVHYAGGPAVLTSAAPYSPGGAELGYLSYASYPTVQYASAVCGPLPPPPPCVPAPPPTRPARHQSCYNCGGDDHLGTMCAVDAGADASPHNQFKLSFVSSISEN